MMGASEFQQYVNWKEGLVDRKIFTDPEIYALEMERIFARAWNFVCHESQVPKAGDYFMNYIGGDQVIAVRNKQGEALANGTKTIESLASGGHVAQFIDELFPNADTDDFDGTLVVQVTGGKVAATVLELGTEAGQFTTLPVTPLE